MITLAGLLTPIETLPGAAEAVLVGSAWLPDAGGPAVVAVRDGLLVNIDAAAPTITDVLNAVDSVTIANTERPIVGQFSDVLANSAQDRLHLSLPWLLAPIDLQPVKTSGVTFAASLLERVVEEQAGGDAAAAEEIRARVTELIGADLSRIRPGSAGPQRLEDELTSGAPGRSTSRWRLARRRGLHQVPPMAAVGTGAQIGVRSDSTWNNPETELAVAVSAVGQIVGAALAKTSTCATSRVAPPCCSARRRTTTHRRGWGRSSGCSTTTSPSTTCGR